MIPFFRRFFDQKNFFGILAIFLLGLGRSSAIWWLSPFAAMGGFCSALIFCRRAPFWYSWALFAIVLLIQSSWLLSHPYSYIWGVWLILSLLFSCPYAFLARLVTQEPRKGLLTSAGWAAAFSLLEWSFTLLPCGYSFQSAALQLSWNLWSLQAASVAGAIGLSFFVFWTNILLFFWAEQPSLAIPAACTAILPYAIGGALFFSRTQTQRIYDAATPPLTVAFCHMEEPPDVDSRNLSPSQLHEQEWRKIFPMISRLRPGEASLLVLPEGAVPFAAESPLFRRSILPGAFGSPQIPLLSSIDIARSMASYLRTPVLIGLEGRQAEWDGSVRAYNSCYCVTEDRTDRYDKQLLIPLGEYIPTPVLASVLSSYGIHDSFSPGKGPALFSLGPLHLSPLICYEETFSSYALAAARLNSRLLVSLTNDCWYPAIRREHFELARLRAVEVGLPLVRSCNQGVSAAVDALGRVLAARDKGNICVVTQLSQYCAPSLYAAVGERPIAALLAALWAWAFFAPRTKQVEEKALR